MQFLDPLNVTDLEWEEFDKELAERFDLKSQFTWSHQEWVAYDRYLDSFRSWAAQIETAKKAARQEGREEFRLERERETVLEIAQNLLDVLDEATIAKVTGLTIEQVEKLKNK